jgi:hypothetical protein
MIAAVFVAAGCVGDAGGLGIGTKEDCTESCDFGHGA